MKKRDCYIEFTAYLKSESGEILARGEGVVNVAERFVTFTSDFVPLYHTLILTLFPYTTLFRSGET